MLNVFGGGNLSVIIWRLGRCSQSQLRVHAAMLDCPILGDSRYYESSPTYQTLVKASEIDLDADMLQSKGMSEKQQMLSRKI